MSIFSGLEEVVKKDRRLAKFTWYGLGGAAQYFIEPRDEDELAEVVRRCGDNELPLRVLGFGSNLLVSDKGVKGAVVKLGSDYFKQVDFAGDTITARAGADLGKLVLACTEKGLAGMEGLTGVPGSVGGAVKMNAGGSFGDIGSVVEKVILMDRAGNVFEKSKPELVFDYRRVNITAKIILAAELALVESDPEQILKSVQEIWIYKKNNQPLNTKNSGCIFKNPRGVSAGALIDRAGLKGLQRGGAKVSEKHANFIVAERGCTSDDVLGLIKEIQEKVAEQFDIELEREIEIWQD